MAGERALHLTKDIVLPLGVVITLASLSYQLGGWKTDKEIKVTQALALAKATAAAEEGLLRRMDQLDSKMERLTDRQKQLERNHERLLNFTTGRIARLPWRASDAQ